MTVLELSRHWNKCGPWHSFKIKSISFFFGKHAHLSPLVIFESWLVSCARFNSVCYGWASWKKRKPRCFGGARGVPEHVIESAWWPSLKPLTSAGCYLQIKLPKKLPHLLSPFFSRFPSLLLFSGFFSLYKCPEYEVFNKCPRFLYNRK